MQSNTVCVQAYKSEQLRPTQNGSAVSSQSTVIEALDGALAATIDVAMAARQAHWNVRGPSFYALHELFGRIQKELDEHADELAERIAALGGIPRGTVQAVAGATRLPAYPLLGTSQDEHMEALASRLGTLGSTLRGALSECERNADTISVHYVTEAWARVDNLRWLVEGHARR